MSDEAQANDIQTHYEESSPLVGSRVRIPSPAYSPKKMGKVNLPDETKFLFKIVAAVSLLVFLIIIGATQMEEVNIKKAFLKSAIVVTHANVSDGDRHLLPLMVLSTMGVVVNFYIIYVLIEFLLEGRMRSIISGVRKMKNITRLKNHYIICGGGRVGLNVAKELHENKKKVLVIEKEQELINKIERTGVLVIKGDALDDHTLSQAGIEKAKYLVACLDNDGDNLLLTLTAKEMNENVRVGARAKEEIIVKKLYHAGAEYVVLPEIVGGVQLAKSIIKD